MQFDRKNPKYLIIFGDDIINFISLEDTSHISSNVDINRPSVGSDNEKSMDQIDAQDMQPEEEDELDDFKIDSSLTSYNLSDLAGSGNTGYSKVLDIMFQSNSYNKDDYRCMIACQIRNKPIIDIFELHGNSDIKQINYRKTEFTNEARVKISEDFRKVVFTSKGQNYILTEDPILGRDCKKTFS